MRPNFTPHETARRDQALAHAREESKNPATGVFVTDYADGQRCCWCDCPDDGPHSQPDYVCDGCPREAYYVLHTMYGTPQQTAYPVCQPHYADLVATVARAMGGES